MKRKSVLAILFTLSLGILAGCSLTDNGNDGEKSNISTKMVDLEAQYSLADGEAFVVIDHSEQTERARLFDGKWYFPLSVAQVINDRFYWNESEEQLIVTNAVSIDYYWPDVNGCRIMNVDTDNGYPMLKTENGRVYLSEELVRRYTGYELKVFEDSPARLVLNSAGTESETIAAVADETCIRAAASLSADIVKKVSSGDILYKIQTGMDSGEFINVCTADGFAGYVRIDDVGQESVAEHTSDFVEPEYVRNVEGETGLTMVWHNMSSAVTGFSGEISGGEGIDVVIPTWYSVIGTDGTISSNASYKYVNNAHNQGLKVWGLVNDFDPYVKGLDVLSNTASRTALIEALVSSALEYGLDGINIDFEYITVESGPHYIQFLRELSVYMRKSGLTLSVDNYVPNSGNTQYNLEAQAQVCDYIILMTYDEHYSVESGVGSVASKGFVENGVEAALEYVEADRLVMGIPFYTRLWETAADGTMSMQVITMKTQSDVINKYNPEMEWDEESGQYHTIYTNSSGVSCEMWLEEDRSITTKKEIADVNGLAGVACWCLGYEEDSVWDVLKQ